MKNFFLARSKKRYDFGHELKSEIKKFGETPDKGTSIKGDLHRSWMNLKSSLSSNEEEAILEETIRGDKAAVSDYNSVLKETNIPPTTEAILTKQRNAIEMALEKVKTLERTES